MEMRISLTMWGITVFCLEAEPSMPDEQYCECEEVDSGSLESVTLRDGSDIDPEVDTYAEAIVHANRPPRPEFGFTPSRRG